MTELVPSRIAFLPWFSRLKGGSTWVTYPEGKVLCSRHFPDKVLHSGLSLDVPVEAPQYCRVLTGKAWCVPVILGRWPKTPTDESTHEQKGRFALLMMVLFKPWRRLTKDILSCLFKPHVSADTNPWQLLYAEYERWFAEMEAMSERVRSEYRSQTPPAGEASLLSPDGLVNWQSPHY